MKTEHIILVTNSLSAGGIERNVRMVASHLNERYRPEVWTFDKPDPDDSVKSPIHIMQRMIRFDPLLVRRMARSLRSHPARIIHLWHFASGIHVMTANRLLPRSQRKKMVFSFGSSRRDSRLISWYFRHVGKHADWITGNSPTVIKGLIEHGLPARLMEVMPNGHDTRPFAVNRTVEEIRSKLDMPVNAKLIVTTGRLVPSKRIGDLIAAMAEPNIRGIRNLHLVIVGDGPLRDELHGLTARLQLDDRVTFAGHRPNVPEYLLASDMFVFPSETEGLPNSLIEAGLAGLPVIACQAPGVVDVINPNDNGILVPVRNPSALASEIERLIQNPELAAKLGASGKKHAQENYSLERMIRHVESIYDKLLASRPGGMVG